MAARGGARLRDVTIMPVHMPTTRAGTAARAAVLALSCALAMLVAAPRVACAQGTSGAFADPLSAGELKMLLERRANVPSAAWPQVQAAHDAYLRRAEGFRDGDIERFQKKSRSPASGQPDPQSQYAQWQATMKEYGELLRKLDAIDDELFVEVAKALEGLPDSAEAVEAAKLARRRQALRMGFGRAMLSPSTMADVEHVAFDVPMPDAARAAAAKALEGYGTKQTPALRTYAERMQQLYLEYMKAQLEAAGAVVAAAAAGEADPQAGAISADARVAQAVWARLGPEVTRQRKQLLANNRAAMRAVREALAADPALQSRFADRWIVESYPAIPDSESTRVPQAGRRALRVRGLDDGARESVRQSLLSWRAADDALVEEWSAATDDFESMATPWSFDDAMYRGFNERVADLQRRRSELAAKALGAIDAAVGAELAPVVRGADYSRDGDVLEPERDDADGAPSGARPAADAGAQLEEFFLRAHRAGIAVWSAPIGDEDVARFAAAIGADEGQRAILESLAADHAAGWAARIDPIFAESRARLIQQVASLEATRQEIDVSDSIGAARVHRDALDAEFFDGLSAVVSGPDAARVAAALRLLRVIDGAARDDSAMLRMRSMAQLTGTRIDPLEGVWPAIAPDRRPELVALLEAQLPAARQSADAIVAAWRTMSDSVLRMRAAGAEMPAAERDALAAGASNAFNALAKGRDALRAAEDSLAEAALALLADDVRARIQLQRTRARHPEIFRDDPVQRAFDRALALEGIDDATRDSIAAALAEYIAARDTSDGALVRAVGARADYPVFDAQSPEAEARFAKQYEAWMLANENVERAKFVRRSGRERALVALSGILGPARAKAARVPDAAELAREEARLNDGLGADPDE